MLTSSHRDRSTCFLLRVKGRFSQNWCLHAEFERCPCKWFKSEPISSLSKIALKTIHNIRTPWTNKESETSLIQRTKISMRLFISINHYLYWYTSLATAKVSSKSFGMIRQTSTDSSSWLGLLLVNASNLSVSGCLILLIKTLSSHCQIYTIGSGMVTQLEGVSVCVI